MDESAITSLTGIISGGGTLTLAIFVLLEQRAQTKTLTELLVRVGQILERDRRRDETPTERPRRRSTNILPLSRDDEA